METIRYIQSARGARKLCYKGCTFTLDRKRNDKEYWKCTIRTCPGRVVMHSGVVISDSEHDHPGSNAEVIN